MLGQQGVFVGTELDQYLRLLELTGRLTTPSLVFRPVLPRHVRSGLVSDSAHPWAARYPMDDTLLASGGLRVMPLEPTVKSVYRSAYPRDVNDGALWAGKGMSGAIEGGFGGMWGPVTFTLYPTIYATANRPFPLAPLGSSQPAFSYPWRGGGIDWPQRFGDEAFGRADWGQTSVRLDLAGFTAGLGTENMWWGPAARYPILMSNTAPGFPHLDLGTGRPVHTFLGRAEARFVWGQLDESPYFEVAGVDDRRFFVGLTAALEPRWLPGLTLGIARAFQLPWDSIRVEDFFVVFQTIFKNALGGPDPLRRGGDDLRDQVLSLYGRWLLPESGFEVYGEWSRTDHSGDLRDLLLEPEHSRAYMLGAAKAVVSGTSMWSVRAEAAQVERPVANALVRGGGDFYVHGIVQQGYTHRGQMLGAAIGPGASSRFLSVDRYTPGGRIGAYAEWVRYDNDAYYDRFTFTTPEGHDVELTLGLSAMRFIGDFTLGGVVAVSRELNRYFAVGNDVTNLHLETRVSWRP